MKKNRKIYKNLINVKRNGDLGEIVEKRNGDLGETIGKISLNITFQMAKGNRLSLDKVRELSAEYNEEEDEKLDIRNVLEFAESAIDKKEIDGGLWQYQLRNRNFGIGEGLNKEIQQVPILSADLKTKIQDFKNKMAGQFGKVKL